MTILSWTRVGDTLLVGQVRGGFGSKRIQRMEGFIRRAENEGDMTRKQKSGTRVGTGRGTVPFIVFIQLLEMECKSLYKCLFKHLLDFKLLLKTFSSTVVF